MNLRTCDRCGKPLKLKQRRFCSRSCAHLFVWRPTNRREPTTR